MANTHKPVMTESPTRKQLVSVCFSRRHDFGLLQESEKETLIFQAREWWRAIAKEVNQPSRHPTVIAEAIEPNIRDAGPTAFGGGKLTGVGNEG